MTVSDTLPLLAPVGRPGLQSGTPRGNGRAVQPRGGAVTAAGSRLVDPRHFLVATRDSGYLSTPLAVAELVDNAIQAGAQSVDVLVSTRRGAESPIEIAVVDDGEGMDALMLAEALTFGGSSRFGDRSSLGRYGMGLPNGALSRARRVEVFTWRATDTVWHSFLDVDEILSCDSLVLPGPRRVERPTWVPPTGSGTAVLLTRCDRIEVKRASSLVQRLAGQLGRIYRHYLGNNLILRVNGEAIEPVDPLFLMSSARHCGGTQFGETLVYSLECGGDVGRIEVRFAELPVERWHALTTSEKRALGVTGTATVSVVRARREVHSGWLLMGDKRRENYDDWWRCEIAFEPTLDELFGITNSKQAVCPTTDLLETLAPDLEAIARALNARVRRRFEMLKLQTPLGTAEALAERADSSLTPVRRRGEVPADLQAVISNHQSGGDRTGRYRIVVTELPSTTAYEPVLADGCVFLLLNSRHPLFRDLYGPLATSESPRDQETAAQIALCFLAAARAEVAAEGKSQRARLCSFRQSWTDVLATFFTA